MDTETERIVRLIPVGNGSRRITIPKKFLTDFPPDGYVKISKDGSSLRIVPIEIREVPKE